MSREVRRVPENWEHPKRNDGQHQPMFEGNYEEIARDWLKEAITWSIKQDNPDYEFYWDWEGPPPDKAYYMPSWKEEEKTHLQMYETTSEGTPISPVMRTPEELARWLADTNASAFGSQTATYDEWLATIKRGWAPSAITTDPGGLVSGVEGMGKL